MIYLLYHLLTDTEMRQNGRPSWVDGLGGLLDMLLLVLYWVSTV